MFTDGRTDRQTDDGRRTIAWAHSSEWAKNEWMNVSYVARVETTFVVFALFWRSRLFVMNASVDVACIWSMITTGLVDFNQTVSSHSLRREVRQYVGNVYQYHRRYIYDVVLYQYRQDQMLPGDQNHDHFRNILLEILGDAQQVNDTNFVETDIHQCLVYTRYVLYCSFLRSWLRTYDHWEKFVINAETYVSEYFNFYIYPVTQLSWICGGVLRFIS